jgi:K+-dependent Na+/Ca+ exchanger-like protein
MAWTFKNLKVMSDVYFVPSTIALAKRWGIPADVAGATLLAFGSSAPEFCTNVVASLFITNECGIGDIVGSAIHNILLIIGVSGLFAGRVLALWWYPLSRDGFVFCVAVLELAIFLWDEHLQIWEASCMICTYFLYCGWMFWNLPIYKNLCAIMKLPADVPDEGDDEDDDGEGLLYYDPAEVLWRSSMPSPTKSSLSCFLQALFHIAWLSYVMVDAATRFGNVVGIPSLFMGLVFLAAGTSIPDAFASLAAARKGEGDMAVSNALGSNIFDILMGLGLPWLISLMIGRPVVFLGVGRLLYWVGVLVFTLVLFLVVVVASGFKLGFKMGLCLVLAYAFYVFWAMLKSFGLA